MNALAQTAPKNGVEVRNMATENFWDQLQKTVPETRSDQQVTQNNSFNSWSRRHVSNADLTRAIALSNRPLSDLNLIMVTDLSHNAGLLNLGIIHRMGNSVELQSARARILAALPLKFKV